MVFLWVVLLLHDFFFFFISSCKLLEMLASQAFHVDDSILLKDLSFAHKTSNGAKFRPFPARSFSRMDYKQL